MSLRKQCLELIKQRRLGCPCNYPRFIRKDLSPLGVELQYISEVEPHTDDGDGFNDASWTTVFHYWKKGFVFVHGGFSNPVIEHRQIGVPITFRYRRYHAFIPESKLDSFVSRKWKKEWPWDNDEVAGDLVAIFEFVPAL